MPGGALVTPQFPSCTCKHHGQQSVYSQPYTNITSRTTDRRQQANCPSLGPKTFVKPFLGINSYTSPYFHARNGFHTIHSENSPAKPRIVTVVKPGSHPLKKITLLLNRRSVQTFEQLVADISEALGFPRWKNDRVKKLYNLKGKEIRSVSDFFRGDDAFIALGREQLTMKNIEIVVNELYPDRPFGPSKDAYKKLCKQNKKALNVSGDFEDTDMANNGCDIVSPGLVSKNIIKAQGKNRSDEARKPIKYEVERWKDDQETSFEKSKKNEHCKQKQLDRTISTSVNGRKCTYCASYKSYRECKYSQKWNSEYNIEGSNVVDPKKRESFTNFPRIHDLKPVLKHEDCHRKWKDFDKYCSDGNVKGKLPMCGNSNWQKSGLQNESNTREQLKSQCPKDKSRLREIRSPAIKPTAQHIEDFLENPNKSILCIEENEVAMEDECIKKKETIKLIDSAKPKAINGLPAKEEEKGTSQLKKTCCIKDKIDIEMYYEIGRTIGDGNFAVVKECRPRQVNMEYAMKIIDKSKLMGNEYIIENEVQIIKSLSHPNIVRLLDDYETDTEIYLILEYVKGGDLFDAITESIKFTEQDAALMMSDLCDALAYLHNKNIVHRDVKPENLLVQHNPDGTTTLKLADFGLAVYVTEPIFTVCGTPTYVAPEILSEKGYGLEVDMWATGVILYILLCGFPPFRSLERNQKQLFEIIQHGEYEFISPYWDTISDEAKDLISKLLVIHPLKRYSAKCVLQHAWISSRGLMNNRNLQKEVTMNIGRHFRIKRKKEDTESEQ
ncbi:serine/threonine-protein kinase DCLK3 [Pelodytes ibericus]